MRLSATVSEISAMSCSGCPQRGHEATSTLKTLRSRAAQRQRVEFEVSRTVVPGALELVADAAGGQALEPRMRQGRAQGVANEMLQSCTILSGEGDVGVEHSTGRGPSATVFNSHHHLSRPRCDTPARDE